MARTERWRESVSELPTEEEVRRRAEQGWKLAAVEWRREAADRDEPGLPETPYGLCTPEGGTELDARRDEQEALRLMLGLVIDDRNSLAAVAHELNRRGFRTRAGGPWSPSAVFSMMPRLVEVAPSIFARPDGSTQRGLTTH
jgi:hypothetical protein